MKRIVLSISLCLATPAWAQDEAFVPFRALTPEVAQEMAEAAMTACRDAGYQVGVTVVDRAGLVQVVLRDRFAGAHVLETSRRKAWTAASFRIATSTLAAQTAPGEAASAIRDLDEPLALGGGLPVYAGDGDLVAGIGISGAPGPDLDEVCAQAGIDAIEDRIAF